MTEGRFSCHLSVVFAVGPGGALGPRLLRRVTLATLTKYAPAQVAPIALAGADLAVSGGPGIHCCQRRGDTVGYTSTSSVPSRAIPHAPQPLLPPAHYRQFSRELSSIDDSALPNRR